LLFREFRDEDMKRELFGYANAVLFTLAALLTIL
jgi:hypothetical protein